MSTMYIFRGLPGSGKSTEANSLGCYTISPQDMYSIENGVYNWDEGNSVRAENLAERLLIEIMSEDVDVAIEETLLRKGDVSRYVSLAEAFSYRVIVKDMVISANQSKLRNTHNVPVDAIDMMAEEFEPWI